MTFQAYIDNIHAKTGKTPADFHAAAKKKGLLGFGFKATPLTDWLKAEYGLGHGHAMAVLQAFKLNGWVATPKASAKKSPTKTKL